MTDIYKQKTLRNPQSVHQCYVDFRELLVDYGYSMQSVIRKRGSYEEVQRRANIAHELHELGYGQAVIGHVMDRDHTSIGNLIKKYKKIEK